MNPVSATGVVKYGALVPLVEVALSGVYPKRDNRGDAEVRSTHIERLPILMSIYATLWSIQIQDPATSFSEPRWVEITAQAVPPHIGSPTPGRGYEDGDPYAAFLPPPLEADEEGYAPWYRAVVFVTSQTHKGTTRHPQEYAEPLLVLSGREYATTSFDAVHERLQKAVRSGPRVVAEFLDSGGRSRVITREDIDGSDEEIR